jgi:hypothetical protein
MLDSFSGPSSATSLDGDEEGVAAGAGNVEP